MRCKTKKSAQSPTDQYTIDPRCSIAASDAGHGGCVWLSWSTHLASLANKFGGFLDINKYVVFTSILVPMLIHTAPT